MMLRALAPLASLFVFGCAARGALPRAADVSSEPPRAAAVAAPVVAAAPRTYATETLIERPVVRELVTRLAAFTRIGDRQVSYDGHEPAEYTAYLQLTQTATKEEMAALTEHASPIVRGYAARYVVEHAFSASRLDRMLSDPTTVATLRGCLGGTEPMGAVVVQALCDHRDGAEPAAMLRSIAAGGDARLAHHARQCLAPSALHVAP